MSGTSPPQGTAGKKEIHPPPSASKPVGKKEFSPSFQRQVEQAKAASASEKTPAEQARQSRAFNGRPSPVQPGPPASYPRFIPQTSEPPAPKTRRKEADQLGSIATELDLAAKDQDDLGPTVADCLNLGSFDDTESPLRDPKQRQPNQQQRRKASPFSSFAPLYTSYRGAPFQPNMPFYPPKGEMRPQPSPPPPFAGYNPAGYPYASPFPPYALPPPEQWNSPFPEEPYRRSNNDEPKKQAAATTPRKKAPAARSPFRSPVPDKTNSAKKFKRSPLFGGTPGISHYGSFGIDTPGGTMDAAKLDEFSPMGPSFPSGFGDEAAPFPPLEGIQFDPKPNDDKKRLVQRRGDVPSSPFSSFLGDMSPLTGNVRLQGSPMEGQKSDKAKYAGASSSLVASPGTGKARGQAPTYPSSKRGGAPKRQLLTSPVATAPGAKQKKGWFDPMGPTPGPVRLELGEVGIKKTLEGINNMVRGESNIRQRGPTFRNDITPVKRETPASGGKSQSAKSSVKKTPISSNSKAQTTPETDKENSTPRSKKRNRCNCKKSKCLKLYCECFAAERFCNECNCSDCHNSQEHESVCAKAIKDTKAKNPNAFKPRIAGKATPGSGPTGNSPLSGHNMGCRCKRSECLKKYCECFQAGVMCGIKCKCIECLNFVGSQALIDKRRKIKDHKGAEFAMRSADEAWKGKQPTPRSLPPPSRPSPPRGSRPQHHSHQTGHHNMHMPPMIQPSPGPQRGPRGRTGGPSAPPPYGMAPYPMGPPMGYSPMGMPPTVTPGYGPPKSRGARSDQRRSGGLSVARGNFHPKHQAPQPQRMVTPRTPAVRLGFDPHSSRKKRKLSHHAKEPTYPFFGPRNPAQTKTVALGVFSYLSNDDLYNAGIVSKCWSRLALDEELWQF